MRDGDAVEVQVPETTTTVQVQEVELRASVTNRVGLYTVANESYIESLTGTFSTGNFVCCITDFSTVIVVMTCTGYLLVLPVGVTVIRRVGGKARVADLFDHNSIAKANAFTFTAKKPKYHKMRQK